MKFHPYSEIFPLLEGADFDELVADIKQHGLREPIYLYRGDILDGRNRYRACQKANAKLQTTTFMGDDKAALAFVVSLNAKRRHLNESQRAMAAAKIANLRAGSNQHEVVPIGTTSKKSSEESKTSVSVENAAQITGASVRSTKRARKVVEQGSKALQKAVEKGEIPVSKAAAVVDLPKAEQLRAATTKSEPPKEQKADLSEFLTKEEVARHDADEQRLMQSLERAAGDSAAEIKRLNGLLAEAYKARDRYMNESAAKQRQIDALQRKLKRLEKAAA